MFATLWSWNTLTVTPASEVTHHSFNLKIGKPLKFLKFWRKWQVSHIGFQLLAECSLNKYACNCWKIRSTLNSPNSQIPQFNRPISHNTPFRTEMCTFLFWMVYCGRSHWIWTHLGRVQRICPSEMSRGKWSWCFFLKIIAFRLCGTNSWPEQMMIYCQIYRRQ